MKHTSKFTFSVLLLLLSFLAHSQTPTSDSLALPILKKDRYGLRVGADLYKLTRSFYDKNYKGLELVGDYRLTKKYYVAGEFGNENKTTADDRVNFTTKGTYFKAGFDYNAYENWLNMENMVYIGLRYGLSTFNQTLNSYQIYNPNPYFNEATNVNSGEKFNGLTAQWLEFVVGMKAEVINNIFVGFSVRFNRLISDKQPGNFENLYIPGFNRTYNGDFGVGFNYSVSYFLPFYKKNVVVKKAEKKKKK